MGPCQFHPNPRVRCCLLGGGRQGSFVAVLLCIVLPFKHLEARPIPEVIGPSGGVKLWVAFPNENAWQLSHLL